MVAEAVLELISGIIDELSRLKLRDIKLYNAGGKSILADYFFISTADTIIQLEAVRNNLIRFMRDFHINLKNNLEDWHGGWCLLDFGNYIVHIFLEERRSFFQIDRLLEGAGYELEKSIAQFIA
jgi:ribosome-associated protein